MKHALLARCFQAGEVPCEILRPKLVGDRATKLGRVEVKPLVTRLVVSFAFSDAFA